MKPEQKPVPNLFLALICLIQFTVLALYATSVKYNEFEYQTDRAKYPQFQDVQVMVFVGFGFLMTFLKRAGYTALTFNLLCAVVSIQLYPLMEGLWHLAFQGTWQVGLNVSMMILSEFGAASVLIVLGAQIGTTTLSQSLVISFISICMYALNERIGFQLGASDIGGSISIHTFGAFFGVASSVASRVASRVASSIDSAKATSESNKTQCLLNQSSYLSDIMSMIGTLFLFVYWPSFNAALVEPGPGVMRAQINTILSLTGSVIATLALSQQFSADRKISMVHVQNATLAGGVAMGAACNMNITPAVALASGLVAGSVSMVGFVYIQSVLETRFGIHDTCGVLHLHGQPGVLGALISVVAAIYTPGLSGTAQLAFLASTIGIALVSGSCTGMIVFYCLPGVHKDMYFCDLQTFKVQTKPVKRQEASV